MPTWDVSVTGGGFVCNAMAPVPLTLKIRCLSISYKEGGMDSCNSGTRHHPSLESLAAQQGGAMSTPGTHSWHGQLLPLVIGKGWSV